MSGIWIPTLEIFVLFGFDKTQQIALLQNLFIKTALRKFIRKKIFECSVKTLFGITKHNLFFQPQI